MQSFRSIVWLPQWQQFFNLLDTSLTAHKEADLDGFEKKIRQCEWAWVNERKDYPLRPVGRTTAVAKELYAKYRTVIDQTYQGDR